MNQLKQNVSFEENRKRIMFDSLLEFFNHLNSGGNVYQHASSPGYVCISKSKLALLKQSIKALLTKAHVDLDWTDFYTKVAEKICSSFYLTDPDVDINILKSTPLSGGDRHYILLPTATDVFQYVEENFNIANTYGEWRKW